MFFEEAEEELKRFCPRAEGEGVDFGEELIEGLDDAGELFFVGDGDLLIDFAEKLGEGDGEALALKPSEVMVDPLQ